MTVCFFNCIFVFYVDLNNFFTTSEYDPRLISLYFISFRYLINLYDAYAFEIFR